MSKLISHILHDELLQTVSIVGIDKTIKALKEAQNISSEPVDFIIESVAEIVGIEKERILSGSSRTDERKIALAICIYFLRNKLTYSYLELKSIFNKDESALFRYNAMIEKIEKLETKPTNEFEKKLLDCFNQMKTKFSEKINKNDSRARRNKGL